MPLVKTFVTFHLSLYIRMKESLRRSEVAIATRPRDSTQPRNFG